MQKDLSGLSKDEMYSILMHLQRSTKFPVAKQICENTRKFFDDKCPGCDTPNEKSRIVRVFKEGPDFDIVTYICSECGTVYRKYEDKRETIQGDILGAIQ